LVRSLQPIFDILLFFFIFAALYALIGMRIIGDLKGEVEYDPVILFSKFLDYIVLLELWRLWDNI